MTLPEEIQTAEPTASNRRRRLAIRLGIGLAAVLVVFVLVVFVLPTPLARYVIESQLEDLGIQYDGIDTVEIDLWNSRVRAGPVRFHSGAAEDGRIGETGFDYSFGALFKGRAFVQTFHLRGVDLHIARLEDGAIEINGVNLRELGGDEAPAAAKPPAPEDEEEDGFGFGVESFEFSDSQLVFEDLSGGTLAIELQRLTLDRLLTWTPEEPTTFTLDGRLNEMQLSIDGTVTPLGDPLLVTFNSRMQGITIDRVTRFVGPSGLARQDGEISTDVHYDYAIHSDGRIDGRVEGTYTFSGFEIATGEGATLSLDDALLEVALQQELRPDGSATAKGQLKLDGSPLSLSSAAGDSLRISSLALAVDELDFAKGAQTRRRLLQGQTASEGTEESAGRAATVVELMIGWARELGEEALNHQLSVQGKPTLTLNDGAIRLAARGGVPAQEILFDNLSVDLGEVASEAFDAGFRADSPLEGVISGLTWATGDGRAGAELAEFRIASEAIGFLANTGETSLTFDLALSLQKLTARDREAGSLDLASLALTTENYTIRETPQDQVAEGPVTVILDDLALTLPGPEGSTTIEGDDLELALSPFSLAGKQGEAASFSGSLAAAGLSLARDGETPLSFSLESTRSDFRDFSVAPLDAQAAVAGGLASTFSGIRLEGGPDAEALTLEVGVLETTAEGLRAGGFDGDTPGVSLASRTSVKDLTARLPLPDGQWAEAGLAAAEAPLSELAFSEGNVSAAGSLEFSGISATTEGDRSQSLDIASLSVTGLSGDSAGGAAAERIAFGEVVAKLALPLPGRADQSDGKASEGGAPPQDAATDAPKPPAGEPAAERGGLVPRFDRRFSLGEFSVAPGSRIEITDGSVEPPLQAQVLLEELKLGPLDTGAPESRSDLSLALTVNDSAKVDLRGWAAPFKPAPDFALTSQVEGLSLPALSPYAATAVGVNIESGALTASTDAKASNADLAGKIDLRIDDLFVTPLSEEEAEKLKADIGLPVGFAVSVLKDGEGVIAFDLPISGTLAAPQVDYSEAINKAISGALASVFPTNWFGPDGNTFEMQPAPFEPGSTELTAEGEDVADEMGELFAEKPGISIRACGRAGRADLVALRGGTPAAAALAPPPPSESGPGAAGPPPAPDKLAPGEEIAAPSEKEVEALLALAAERGAAVRKYLEAGYGIDPARLPACRTAYSIKDGKPPRAEFQF